LEPPPTAAAARGAPAPLRRPWTPPLSPAGFAVWHPSDFSSVTSVRMQEGSDRIA
jgi:hypothetical protein